jgi:glycine/D-amino acid oxidase-like deaminating enzyme
MTTSFAGVTLGRTVMTNAILDINPCDEIPIAGPMYGRGRLLVAAGFLGLGLSQGFLAGRCLADLVKDGRCDDLPRQLWPERLRSMEA